MLGCCAFQPPHLGLSTIATSSLHIGFLATEKKTRRSRAPQVLPQQGTGIHGPLAQARMSSGPAGRPQTTHWSAAPGCAAAGASHSCVLCPLLCPQLGTGPQAWLACGGWPVTCLKLPAFGLMTQEEMEPHPMVLGIRAVLWWTCLPKMFSFQIFGHSSNSFYESLTLNSS